MRKSTYRPPQIDIQTYCEARKYQTLYEAMKREIQEGIAAHDNAIRVTDENEKPRTLSGLVASRNTLVELLNVMRFKEEQEGIEEEPDA